MTNQTDHAELLIDSRSMVRINIATAAGTAGPIETLFHKIVALRDADGTRFPGIRSAVDTVDELADAYRIGLQEYGIDFRTLTERGLDIVIATSDVADDAVLIASRSGIPADAADAAQAILDERATSRIAGRGNVGRYES